MPSSGYQPGMLERALTAPLAAAADPLGTASAAVTSPIHDAITALLAPSVGDLPHDPRLSKGGNSGGMTMQAMQTPYDAQHGGVTDGQRAGAVARLVVQALAPEAVGAASRAAPGVLRAIGDAAAGARIDDLNFRGLSPVAEAALPPELRGLEIPVTSSRVRRAMSRPPTP